MLPPLSLQSLPPPNAVVGSLDTSGSCVSSPLSAALSPACSEVGSLGDASEELAIPPTLRRAMSLSSLAAGAKQRRKRSRTTPEQLVKLEEYFLADQSPTSARRRDIARELGLDERQTQIWFQNRRAKSKLQAKMKARAVEKVEPPPRSPPPLTSGFDAEVHGLIHEEDEVTVIPCTDLTIGTWRRVASSQHDLIAYTCESRRCISWFVRAAALSFKIEVPYDIITESRFSNVSPGVGAATFTLDRPPIFYIEKQTELAPGVEPTRHWQARVPDLPPRQQHLRVELHARGSPAHAHPFRLRRRLIARGLLALLRLPGRCPPAPAFLAGPPQAELPQQPPQAAPPVPRTPPPQPTSQRAHGSLPALRHVHPQLASLAQRRSRGGPATGPMLLYMDGSGSPQYAGPPLGGSEQLPRLSLGVPDLPRLNYDYTSSRAASPHEGAPEPPLFTASTPGYHGAVSPWDGSVVPYIPQGLSPAERPQEPFYSHAAHGYYSGPVYDRGGGSC
ncbi:hypothetical protein BN946_scf184355.g3 [Trametes cinnabarina]|uniref:Homeobox domain-containing protein n=1 Tax=Pycnoporus cinnabarinus TaxID=5643 RepID=A0A060SJ01_PYCCI|nr:hypothetical protein BN946_scf184355.g3 [Trametes cinnabarina]